jgi:hypothetical protein
MSAAATAAGYLYASGRLRGKNKEAEDPEKPQAKRRPIRVAALPSVEETYLPAAPRKPAKPVRVAYRTRRWKPEDAT